MEDVKSELAAADCGDGDGDDCDYGSPNEEPESKFIDIYYHPVKEEPEPEFSTTNGGSGDSGTANDYTRIIAVDGYYVPLKEHSEPKLGFDDDDYGSAKEEPESKVVDIYYRPLKEEPEPELGDGGGDAIDANDSCGYGLLKNEPKPELTATGDDSVTNDGRAVSYNCSLCGIDLRTQEFKVEHELQCAVPTKQKELESQVSNLYDCGYCKCRFLSTQYKERHQEIWCPQRPAATRKRSNRVNQKELESQVSELYHCGFCRCPFLNEEHKEQHQQRCCRKKTVAAGKDFNGTYFKCSKCEYVTTRKINAERHVLCHNKNDAEWFTCMQCAYRTVHKCTMIRHMKTHDNISFCCPICEKSFRSKRPLHSHLIKRHFDESDVVSKLITSKIYTCHICNQYRTIEKTDLNEHLAVSHKHAGCQKYVCPRCPYPTFHKDNFQKHSKTHLTPHDTGSSQCAVCKNQFIEKRVLDSHVLSNHADNLDLAKTITSQIHRCDSCSFKTT